MERLDRVHDYRGPTHSDTQPRLPEDTTPIRRLADQTYPFFLRHRKEVPTETLTYYLQPWEPKYKKKTEHKLSAKGVVRMYIQIDYRRSDGTYS